MKTRMILLCGLALLAGASRSSCCQRPPPPADPNPRSFIVAKAAAAPAAMAIDIGCRDDQECIDKADTYACTVSAGCGGDGKCNFGPRPGCGCFEGQIRWCTGSTSKVQFCAQTSATPPATDWQTDCGPTSARCSTGIPACDEGNRWSQFDTDKALWILDPNAPCVPTATCPREGAVEICASVEGCVSTRTYHLASGWSACTECPAPATPEICDGLDNNRDGLVDNGLPDGGSCSISQGECARHARLRCTDGSMQCIAGTPSGEGCDGLDNDCDGLADPLGVCGEVVVRQQSDTDNGREMTWSPGLPTDLIDGYRTHGGPCGEDDHGRPYYRTRAEVSAASSHGAICELAGPYGGYLTPDKRDCRIRVHYKTVRMGSNVWCSGTWWAAPVGAYVR